MFSLCFFFFALFVVLVSVAVVESREGRIALPPTLTTRRWIEDVRRGPKDETQSNSLGRQNRRLLCLRIGEYDVMLETCRICMVGVSSEGEGSGISSNGRGMNM